MAMVALFALFAPPGFAADQAAAPVQPAARKYPDLPSEIPDRFVPVTSSFDFTRREEMIVMRDGVRLHTVIIVPKGAKGAPILLTRTPYDASGMTSHADSSHLGPILDGYDNATEVIVEGGYIRVVQDVRGKHGSEGDYVMNRPLHGPLNPTPVDHSTDTYDTIDWLVKNIPESNGKVGILGISYDGFLPLMALVNPHPALKVAVAMNPMVDGWMGDDWFHNGAFRELNLDYIYEQESTARSEGKWWRSHHDEYDAFMEAVSAGEIARLHGLEQVGFWRKILAHPAYDSFWQGQAVDRVLAGQPLRVPLMLVHSLWDQEDIYGAMAVYRALKPKDTANDKALYFRREILRPFLDHYLKEGAPKSDVPPVSAFETGTNRWRRLPAWPVADERGEAVRQTPLYLRAGLGLSFDAPAANEASFEEYVSDPAKPVPFRARPILPVGYSGAMTWPLWLADDQREASGRPDVLVYTSDVLTAPVRICGQPIANLIASTSGTDSDWVVKLIDVYPDEVASQPEMGGYQLMVSADIFRGRYRGSPGAPHPLESGEALVYRFALPTANHVFLPGHRLMVQIQSSWFPLYDRNPQTYVPDIFWAHASDYRKATQRVYHTPGKPSFVELPLAPVP
jgi:putative CocE/NonD family hydrolase